jgi:DNA-binding Xre family transcriptional regulator
VYVGGQGHQFLITFWSDAVLSCIHEQRRSVAVTKTKPFSELAAMVEASPVRRAQIATYKGAMEDALALAELRAERGLAETEVAQSLGVTQANTSRIEHEEDLYLSTLRGYLAALGAELEVNAVFPEGKVTLVPASR